MWFFSTASLCSRSRRIATHVASAFSMWFSTARRKSKMPAPPRRSLIMASSSRLVNI